MAIPGPVRCRESTPNGIEAVNEKFFALDIDIGSVVLEIGNSDAFKFLFKVTDSAMPAIVISRASKDTVWSRDFLKRPCELRKGRRIIDDEISSYSYAVRFFCFHSFSKFSDQFFVSAGPIVDVGNLGDSKSIERFWPPRKEEVFSGDRQQIWLDS